MQAGARGLGGITTWRDSGTRPYVLLWSWLKRYPFYSVRRYLEYAPPLFSQVHPRFKTPYITTIITGIVAAVVAGLFPIGLLGELYRSERCLAISSRLRRHHHFALHVCPICAPVPQLPRTSCSDSLTPDLAATL